MRELGLPGELRFAPYHQVFQELLNPAGLFARNTSGANVVLVRFDDWPAGHTSEFLDAVRAAAASTTVPLILVLCPSSVQLDDVVRRGVADLPSVYLLTASEIAALYSVAEVHDPHGNELGRVPYTPLYFVALATALARRIHAIVAPQFKSLRSIAMIPCGLESAARRPEGVVLDPPRRALQQFMAERRREGCCSPCAARTMKRMWPPRSALIRHAACARRFRARSASIGIPRPAIRIAR